MSGRADRRPNLPGSGLTSIAGGAVSARCLEADADRDTPQPLPRMSPTLAPLTHFAVHAAGIAVNDVPGATVLAAEEHILKGLVGKCAIVTGGSSGMGQAIAIPLGEEGVDVAINYGGVAGRRRGDQGTDRAWYRRCMNQLSAAAPFRPSLRPTSPTVRRGIGCSRRFSTT